jgi:hypothetical protein
MCDCRGLRSFTITLTKNIHVGLGGNLLSICTYAFICTRRPCICKSLEYVLMAWCLIKYWDFYFLYLPFLVLPFVSYMLSFHGVLGNRLPSVCVYV